MKTAYSDEQQMRIVEPRTPLEAVQELESFLLCHAGTMDLLDMDFIRSHFKICKDQIKEME